MAKEISSNGYEGSYVAPAHLFDTLELDSGRVIEGIVVDGCLKVCEYNPISTEEAQEILGSGLGYSKVESSNGFGKEIKLK